MLDPATFARQVGAAIADADDRGAAVAASFLRGPVRLACQALRHGAIQLPPDQLDAVHLAIEQAEAAGTSASIDPALLRRLLSPTATHASPADCRECPYHPTPEEPETRRHIHG
jgi:hypothetical protein